MKTRASLTAGYVVASIGLFLAVAGLLLALSTVWSIIPAILGVLAACWGFEVVDEHKSQELAVRRTQEAKQFFDLHIGGKK